MEILTSLLLACANLWTLIVLQGSVPVSAVPVYGYNGATETVFSGHTLHYTIHLRKCQQLSGPIDPEFGVTFGGHVTSWRSFNGIGPIPFMTFDDQKMVFNDTGNLAQLSREVKLFGNDTAFVTTYIFTSYVKLAVSSKALIFTADYSRETYMYFHRCSMTSATTRGAIDLEERSESRIHLERFEDLVTSLEAGKDLHYMAMTFICAGGREHTFSVIGGIIKNYDLQYDDDALVEIKTSIDKTVYNDAEYNMGVLSIVNMRIFSNTTVDIYDNIGVPPDMHRFAVHRYGCYLSNGAPGGSVNVWTRGG